MKVDDQVVLTDLRLLDPDDLPRGVTVDDGPNAKTEICVKATFAHAEHLGGLPGIVAGCFAVTWRGSEVRLIGDDAAIDEVLWLGPAHLSECAPTAPWTVSLRVVEADQLGVDEVIGKVATAFGGERSALVGDAGQLLDRAFEEMFPPPVRDLGQSDVAFGSGEGDADGTTTRAPAPTAVFRYSVDKVVRKGGRCAGGTGGVTSTTARAATTSAPSSTGTTVRTTSTTSRRTTTTTRRTTTTTRRVTTTTRRTPTTRRTSTTRRSTTTTEAQPTTTAVEGDNPNDPPSPPTTAARLAAAVEDCDAEPKPFCTDAFEPATGWRLLREAAAAIAPVDDEPDAARLAPRSREVRRALIRYVGGMGQLVSAGLVEQAARSNGAGGADTGAAQSELDAATALMDQAIERVDPTMLRTSLVRFEHAVAVAAQPKTAAPDDGGDGTSSAPGPVEIALLVILGLAMVAVGASWLRQGSAGRHSRGKRRAHAKRARARARADKENEKEQTKGEPGEGDPADGETSEGELEVVDPVEKGTPAGG